MYHPNKIEIMISRFIFLFAFSGLLSSCAFRSVSRSKDILFDPPHQLALDVYAPKKLTQPANVLLFIHGGNWIHGKKSIYKFLGKRMAKKGIVTVVADYQMGDRITYEMMTADVASAVKWTKENITTYGGDSSKLFISGHSAGGHLAALVATDNHYFNNLRMTNPLKGVILLDAFGLDMYSYLKNSDSLKNTIYFPTFSKTESTWKKASPINHLHKGMPPFLMFLGTKTFAPITADNHKFLPTLQQFQPDANLILKKHKNHFEMIFMFLNPKNRAFEQIIAFMKNPK